MGLTTYLQYTVWTLKNLIANYMLDIVFLMETKKLYEDWRWTSLETGRFEQHGDLHKRGDIKSRRRLGLHVKILH